MQQVTSWQDLSESEKQQFNITFKGKTEFDRKTFGSHLSRRTSLHSVSTEDHNEKFLNSSFDYDAESQAYQLSDLNQSKKYSINSGRFTLTSFKDKEKGN